MKKCSKCKESKNVLEFYRDKSTKDGLGRRCKICINAENLLYVETHRKKVNEIGLRWRKKNPERVKEVMRNFHKNNPEKTAFWTKRWNKANPERRAKIQQRADAKRKLVPKIKLSKSISDSMYQSLRENKDNRHWESLVDFTLQQLQEHIEKLFVDGMTWGKYMKGEIHLDHKTPVSAFNFQTVEDIDFKKCWSLGNLQPLWKTENLKKYNKVNEPFQPSLLLQERN